jgi:hypothetical protein
MIVVRESPPTPPTRVAAAETVSRSCLLRGGLRRRATGSLLPGSLRGRREAVGRPARNESCVHSPQWRGAPGLWDWDTFHVPVSKAFAHVVQEQVCVGTEGAGLGLTSGEPPVAAFKHTVFHGPQSDSATSGFVRPISRAKATATWLATVGSVACQPNRPTVPTSSPIK